MIIDEILAILFIGLACYTDLKYLKIPNRLSLLPYVTGVFLYTIKLDFIGLLKASLGALLLFVILFLLYLTKGLGAGDVKFLTGLAFLLDFNRLSTIVIYSFLIAGLVAMFIYILKYVYRLFNTKSTSKSKSTIMSVKHIPFMITVLPAFIFDWYIEVLL